MHAVRTLPVRFVFWFFFFFEVWQIIMLPPSVSSYFSLNNYLSSAQVKDKHHPLQNTQRFTRTRSEQTGSLHHFQGANSVPSRHLDGGSLAGARSPHLARDPHRSRDHRGKGMAPADSQNGHSLPSCPSDQPAPSPTTSCMRTPHGGTRSQHSDPLQ